MSVDSKHKEYQRLAAQIRTVRDALSEESIKAAADRYLPKTSAMLRLEYLAENEKQAGLLSIVQKEYEVYRKRAQFPELLAGAVRGLSGLLHRAPAVIELPPAIDYLRNEATPEGDALSELHKRVTREVLLTGRYPLLVDVGEDRKPYIVGYQAESLINWGDKLEYAVFAETYKTGLGDIFEPELDVQYRALFIDEDGRYVQQLFRADEIYEAYEPSLFNGERLDYLPMVIASSVDNSPSIDELPMLAMAKLLIKAYQISADYYQSMHDTSQGTLITSGRLDGERQINLGRGHHINFPEGGSATFLESQGIAIGHHRTEIDKLLIEAEKHGGKFQQGYSAESGEALRVKAGNQHASLKSIAVNCGDAIRQSLRFAAEFVGADPDDVVFEPNLEFIDDIADTQLLNVVGNQVTQGIAPKSVLHEAYTRSRLTDVSFEEWQALISESDVMGDS